MTTTRIVVKEIVVKVDANTLFDALLRPSMIRRWWFADRALVLPEQGGIYAVGWGDEDEPDYVTVSTIRALRKPALLRLSYDDYYAKTGRMPFEADMEVTFRIKELEEGCELGVEQSGFPTDPVADVYFQGCVKGWEDTLASLKNVLEGD